MKTTAIKTAIVHAHDNLEQILRDAIIGSIKTIPENSVLAVTSKIVALCEGSVKPKVTGDKQEKHAVVASDCEFYTEPSSSRYDVMLTIKNSMLAVNAGLDESNADNQYVLLPRDSYAAAAKIWQFLRSEYGVKNVGVLITDSKTFPLKWGTMGTALGHCGFAGLHNRIGEKDLFGHEMVMTQVNVAEALAAASVLAMGEVAEQTPLCLVEDIPQIVFQDAPLSPEEIQNLHIAIEDDVFAPILTKADWRKGSKL